jgi:hypothetical protein
MDFTTEDVNLPRKSLRDETGQEHALVRRMLSVVR